MSLSKIQNGDMELRRGDRDSNTGGAVSQLQQLLIQNGIELPDYGVDGKFEQETQAAVNKLRTLKGLPATGVFDYEIMNKVQGGSGILSWLQRQISRRVEQTEGPSSGSSTGMSHGGIDVGSLAQQVGMKPAFLMAIMKIESAGNPSAIRFEPHLFNRKTSGAKVPFTQAPGKSFSLTSSETNRGAFDRAFAIDPDAAVRSTSWGLGQVLGGHLINLYRSPQRGVEAFYTDPNKVSMELIVEWLRDSPSAVSAANKEDFAGFARLYNGPNYKMNNYDVKLREAYERAGVELA